MTFTESARIVRRRWYAFVPVLLVGLAGTLFLVLSTPTEFEATSSLVVLSPTQVVGQESEGPINPFLNFGGSQDTAAQVLGVRMGDAGVVEQLEDAGVSGEWTFEIQGGAGPLALVTVVEPSPAEALDSTSAIVKEAQEQFVEIQLQSGSPESQLVRLSEVSTPGDPLELTSKKTRNAAAGVGLSFLLAIGAAFASEGISRGRQRRRKERTAAPAPGVTRNESWSTSPMWPRSVSTPPPSQEEPDVPDEDLDVDPRNPSDRAG